MPDLRKCRKCGVDIQSNAPFGHCPQCLLALGFGPVPKDAVEPPAESNTLSPSTSPEPGAGSNAESVSQASPDLADTCKPGNRIGRYKVLEKIGEGGCGVVYMAEQEEPVRRRVALKVLKLGMDTREVIARFEAERQALALMDHPHIAKVFDGGATETGRPFFVMELVRGIRITEYCDQKNLSPRQRLELFTQVCHAVQHAHQKGIIHRDLKPSNILVTVNDGIAVPKVIDFGIAKATGQSLTDKTLFTKFNQFLGTPAYTSPEQAEITSLDIDTRSDIYSLGVLLYELLTGRTPFDTKALLRAGFEEMLRTIREQEPARPSARLSTLAAADLTTVARQRQTEAPKLIRLLRGDLDWIVMKCLEKDRTRRYETANGVALDLQRHLDQEPVFARPPAAAYRLQKFVQRNKGLVASTSAIALVLLLGVLISTWQWRDAVGARQGEAHQRRVAETNAAESLDRLVRIDVANGVRAMENEDSFGALLWFAEALRQDRPGLRAEEMHRHRIGAMLNYSPRLTEVWFHEGAINHATFSPDGHWVLTCGRDQTARLWDVQSSLPGSVFRHDTNVSEATFGADGARILTVCDDGTVRVWNTATGQLACPPLEHGYRITRALISPDGRRVFTVGDPTWTNLATHFVRSSGEESGEVRIWSTVTGRPVRPPFHQSQRVNEMVLSPDGQWLATAWSRSAIVWNLRQPGAVQFVGGTESRSTHLPGRKPEQNFVEMESLLPEIPPARKSRGAESPQVRQLAFSPDSQRLLTQYGDGSAHVWPLSGGQPVILLMKTRGLSARGVWERAVDINTVGFSPDGRRVLLADDDGKVGVWDVRTGESETQFQGKGCVRVWFSPDGRFVCLSSQLWDIEKGEPVSPAPLHPYLASAAFSPDGARLLTAGGDGAARLWDLSSGLPSSLAHDSSSVTAPQAATQERPPGNIREQLQEAVLMDNPEVSHAAFSPDGLRVVTASWNGTARVWDATSGLAITPYVTLPSFLDHAVFSKDGTCFAVAGGAALDLNRGMARVWDARSGLPLSPIIQHSQRLKSVAFSPDGRWLITHSDEAAQVWDARSGQPVELPMKFDRGICSLAISPDGRMMAVCSVGNGRGNEIRFWNAQTGQPLTPPLEETNAVGGLEFSPDGRWLVTFTKADDQLTTTARVWAAATAQPMTPSYRLLLGQVPRVTFAANSRRVFFLPLIGEPIIWDLPGGQVLDAAQWRVLKLDPAAVTADGQRFVTETSKGELQVRDAATGEPLTPPLGGGGMKSRSGMCFSSDGSLFLDGVGKRAQLWPLPKETRPVDDLVSLAQLLAGRKIDPTGNLVPWPSSAAAGAWTALRAKYPASFAVAPRSLRQWREGIVDTSERAELWFAAGFHLDQLARENPTDETLRVRRARARNRMAMEELK